MTPEERDEVNILKAKIKGSCLRSVTTLLLVCIFFALTQALGSPLNIYLTIGFFALGMVWVGEWITKLIYGAGPIYVPKAEETEE
jgi:hypothetical protein